jgi:hypothetical protein
MARFRCGACGQEDEFVYDPKHHQCPRCGSTNVVFALPVDELPDGIVEMLVSAERLDDHETDKD